VKGAKTIVTDPTKKLAYFDAVAAEKAAEMKN
jgi:hypothetical protein